MTDGFYHPVFKPNISLPLNRFEEFGELTERERQALAELAGPPRYLDAGQPIRKEGSPVNSFFMLLNGWALSSMIVPSGDRQILKVHLKGDALGTPSMGLCHAMENLHTVTKAVVADVPLSRFGKLIEEHPRVSARFLLSVQRERAALMDQLVSIGRTSAESRLAAFLLDMKDRLSSLGEVTESSFNMFLTQEQIGDVVGLTPVHVNRMFRLLTEQGLIRRQRRSIRIENEPALIRLAARRRRPMASDLSWLPAGR